MASAFMPVVGISASLGFVPVSDRKAFWSCLMVCSIVAFLGADSETYVRRLFAAMHARGTCFANGCEAVDSLREHWRSAWRATVGAVLDMLVWRKMG